MSSPPPQYVHLSHEYADTEAPPSRRRRPYVCQHDSCGKVTLFAVINLRPFPDAAYRARIREREWEEFT